MSKTILEPSRRLRVRGECDVVVVGGGIAGVAAALAAAREGARVFLLEKECGLGGLATLGNIIHYLPLCDGLGHRVSGGLAEALLKLSVRDGSAARAPLGKDIPACWRGRGTAAQRSAQRYTSAFNAAMYAMELERLVVGGRLRNQVQLRYDTRFCAVSRQEGKSGGRITHVICEDKGGRFAIACAAVVDASGDADVCLAAGEAIDSCPVNVPCGWFYYLDGAGAGQLVKFSRPYDAGAQSLPAGEKEGFGVGDGGEVTRMVLRSNRLMERRLGELARAEPGIGSAPPPAPQLLRPPSIASYRMTRRLRGEYELRAADERVWFKDTVGMIGHWRKRGPIYCIPLRSLCAVRNGNLLAVGRCMSSARDAWDITRVIPACAVTGQAAGVAAALLAGSRAPRVAALPLEEVQNRLRRRRVVLNPRLLQAVQAQDDPEGLRAEGL